MEAFQGHLAELVCSALTLGLLQSIEGFVLRILTKSQEAGVFLSKNPCLSSNSRPLELSPVPRGRVPSFQPAVSSSVGTCVFAMSFLS